ncbi:hypothetical protein FRF71_09865 [Novosphingobium ginsenosidimutans]|uniref:Uncharacterized protein n=2 Tax=Novosphingobium ginsenosidimutans TaxID=1176536 RepID=A0A5B8S8N6_9SPHN|nr:hypothetical protein FRF71_09865 [Novosphingobium ginsenosidimutans]
MIVLIVLIVTIAGIYRSKHGLDRNAWREARRMRRDGLMGDGSAEPARLVPSQREEELLREVSDLRERIKVLERIATDGRSSAALANEIESLRERKD